MHPVVPTIIPSYVYSLFAALVVGSIIIYACNASVSGIRNDANTQVLQNIDQYVAAQSLNLLAHTTETGQNTTQYLEVPANLGGQRFWVQIGKDASSAWVKSGFGTEVFASQTRVSIPADVVASGTYVSGSGRPYLQCSLQGEVFTLTLTSG